MASGDPLPPDPRGQAAGHTVGHAIGHNRVDQGRAIRFSFQGVDELDQDKLAPLLRLRYKGAISDAFADLGNPEQVRGVFVGFQRYLYEPRTPAFEG